MRYLLILFLTFSILSCNSSKNKSQSNDDVVGDSYSGPPNPYFNFDKVEYFSIDFDSNNLGELYQSKSDSAKRFLEIYERWYPTNMEEASKFRDELLQYGYTKYEVKDSLHFTINNIFSEKECEVWEAAACIPEYRDILIFYKDKKVIGIGKVCFGCDLSHITGTKVPTGSFGQCGDFEKLEELVKNQNNLISE